MTVARRIVVHGRVQGVGFRYSMTDAANAAGVVGWVRNRADGTVEALLQGDPPAVERVIAWCRRGPPAAKVAGVVIADVEVDTTHEAFGHRPTE